MSRRKVVFATATAVMLSACSAGQPQDSSLVGLPGGEDDAPFAGIAHGEHIGLSGTEPFWGGEIIGGTLIYRTPDNPDGQAIEIERFAGRGGVSFSGELRTGVAQTTVPLDLMITPGKCSDGMSDRTYPFTATLRLDDEIRVGCAWSTGQPHSDNSPES